MRPSRLTPAELAEALRDLAHAGHAETWPDIPPGEVVEADAADFVDAAAALLRDVAASGGEFAERARAILFRLE